MELSVDFPESEIHLIDMTLRMFTEPVFHVDDALLQEREQELRDEKTALLESLIDKLKCETAEDVRKRLASNKQFADVLTEFNIAVPMKSSKTTGKEDRKSTRLNSSHIPLSRMPSSA